MKQVDLSIERLIEIVDEKQYRVRPWDMVQAFLENWCKETFSETPVVTHILRFAYVPGSNDKAKSYGGMTFEFRNSANAMLFKLTWA